MKRHLKFIVPLIASLLAFMILTQPVLAACTGGPNADVYVWPGAPVGEQPPFGTNYDGQGLKAGYACSPGPIPICGPENKFSFVKYDLTGVTQIINSVAISFTTTLVDRNNTGNVTFSFYETTDGWASPGLPWDHNPTTTAPMRGALIGTATANLTAAGQVLTFNDPALATYFESQRTGDGVASITFHMTSGPGTGYTRVTFADMEDATPSNRPGSACFSPTAIGLQGLNITPSGSLTIIYLLTIIFVAITLSLLGLYINRKPATKEQMTHAQ